MSKKQVAKNKIVLRLKSCQWNSFSALRGLFLDRGYFPPKQSISDSTIRRVLKELEKEGLICSKWKCIFPRFFLVYEWLGDL